ncbi:hypothetical protein Pelo_11014 [Pelomyxa schiedti]|nr:hypothetical protein Pelo_11014 [Pelomyxa schiedti]
MKSKTPELKHIELKEVVVDDEEKKPPEGVELVKKEPLPESSLIPLHLWEQCASVFCALPATTPIGESTDNHLVSVEDVKKQWKHDHEEASRFEINSITGIVEQEKNGKAMSLKGFALGCALFPQNKSMLPRCCSVKEYIETGFRGSSTLSMLCESQQKRRKTLALWVFLLIANLAISIASMANWTTSLMGVFTFAIAIYLHCFWHYVLFTWKNEHLSGSALAFAIWGCLDLASGFCLDMMVEPHSRNEIWYWYLYCWCFLQIAYMILSTIYIANVCRLLWSMSHDTVVPVPKYTVFTSHTMTAWVSLFLYAFLFVFFIIFGITVNDVHIAPFSGTLAFHITFVIPAVGILIAMLAKGYPKKMIVVGLCFAALLTLAAIGGVIGYRRTGRFIPYYGD